MRSTLTTKFAERADLARKSKGLSQATIAKRMGVTQQTIASYLNGKGLDLDTPKELADAIGESFYSLLQSSGELVAPDRLSELEGELRQLRRLNNAQDAEIQKLKDRQKPLNLRASEDIELPDLDRLEPVSPLHMRMIDLIHALDESKYELVVSFLEWLNREASFPKTQEQASKLGGQNK